MRVESGCIDFLSKGNNNIDLAISIKYSLRQYCVSRETSFYLNFLFHVELHRPR